MSFSILILLARLLLFKGECEMLISVLCGFMFLLLVWVDTVLEEYVLGQAPQMQIFPSLISTLLQMECLCFPRFLC